MANARNAKSAREKAAEMRAETERAAARKRTIIVGVAVVAVLAFVIGMVVLVQTLQKQAADKEAARVAPPANAYSGVSKVGPGYLMGQQSAKVTVDVYADFLCPICKEFEAADGPVLQKYAADGKIKLVYHPVAILDHASQGTAYSTRAANAFAVVLNTAPDKAMAFHNALFENQPAENGPGLPDQMLISLAQKVGANQANIAGEITGQKFGGWVSSTTDKFTKVFPPGGTPTVAIDGVRTDKLATADLTKVIEAALAK